MPSAHLIRGWITWTSDGPLTDSRLFQCTDLDSVDLQALTEVHAEDRAIPPLDSCGHPHLS